MKNKNWTDEQKKEYDEGYDAGYRAGVDCRPNKFNDPEDSDPWKCGYYYGYGLGHNTGGRF